MNSPRLAILVNGSDASIEAVRARELSRGLPPDRTLILLRSSDRRATAAGWRRELTAFRPDLLHVINTALPGVMVALEWRRRHGTPFVLDTGDVIYEMARSAGTAPWWKLPLLRLIENHAQRRAATLVVRGTNHREYLKLTGHPRVVVIPDGYVEHGPVGAKDVEVLREGLGLGDDFVVGVMGSLVHAPRLGICYGWDLIRALAELRDRPVRGLILGDGPGRPWLEALAREQGVADRIVFCGRIPYDQVPAHLRLLDIALSTQTNNLAGQVRTTGKLPEYMAAGRFILASRVGEAARVLPEPMLLDYEGDVDAGYPSRLATRVRALLESPDTLDLRQDLPARAQKLFSYAVLRGQFEEMIAETSGFHRE
jgi:glycosyltransferase involved in cell wall biosynthesis